jgi:hypothetical protein
MQNDAGTYNRIHMRVAQALLTTDGVVLLWYGIVSLLFVPGTIGEAYLSSGRLL